MPDPSGRPCEWSSRIALAILKQLRQCVSTTNGTFGLYSTDIVQTLRTFKKGQWPMPWNLIGGESESPVTFNVHDSGIAALGIVVTKLEPWM